MLSTLGFLLVAGVWPVFLALEIPDSCEINSLYREMGCSPVFEKGSKCPVEYDCGNFMKFSPNMCYYNGKAYAKGAELPKEENLDGCQFHCRCQNAYPKVGNAAWICASGECFGDMYVEGCVDRFNSLQDCCRNSSYCEKTDPKPELQCSYKGTTYVEGQIIYDEDKCRRCICDANFKETLEGPSCQQQSCGYMLHHTTDLRDGCVPVYYAKSHCSCPIEHKCPEPTDAVAKSTIDLASSTISRRKCKFGDLTLKVGEKLVKKETELFECTCQTPPYVTCVQKPHEDKKPQEDNKPQEDKKPHEDKKH